MRSLIWSRAMLLALLCAGLCAVLYMELHGVSQRSLATEASGASARPDLPRPEEPAVAVPPLAAYAPVIERPVFSPTRRPPLVPEPLEARPTRQGGITLKGVVLSPQKRIALLEIPGSGSDPQRIAEGERLEGWTVEAVLADHVLMRNGEVMRRLELHADPVRHGSGMAGAISSRVPGEGPLAQDRGVDAEGAVSEPRPRLAQRDPETGSRLARAIRMLKAATAGSGPTSR
jgi:hypothetical protein